MTTMGDIYKVNFLQFLDVEYENDKKKNNVPTENKEYRYYEEIIPINFFRAQKFQCLKINKKSKILICFNNLKVYLSDVDILKIILKMEEEQINWFIDNFIKVYNESYEEFEFIIGKEKFKGIGLPYQNTEKSIYIHTDNEINIDSFIFILNFIISKDYLATLRLQESNNDKKNKKNLMKATLCKYISLLKFYYFGDKGIEEFLEGLGYPISENIDNVFSSYRKTKKISQLFNNFNVFEEKVNL